MHATLVFAFVVLREGDKNITKSVWTLPYQPIMITNMRKLNVRFTKREVLDFSKPYLLHSLQKLLEDLMDIGEKYLIRVQMDGSYCPIFVNSWTMRKNSSTNARSSKHFLNLKTMRDER